MCPGSRRRPLPTPDFLGILSTPFTRREPATLVTTVQAHIIEPAGVTRRAWPVTCGLPFAPGELRDASRIQLLDCEGRLLPACASPRAIWPDGSIRWALLDLQTDIDAQDRLDLHVDTDGEGSIPDTGLHAQVRDDVIDVLTGEMAVRVARSGPRLMRSASRGQREYLRPTDDGADLLAWERGSGAPFGGVVEGAEVEESNPLRLVIRAHGSFRRDGERLFGWIARLTFFAGHSDFRMQFTFVHDETTRSDLHLRRLLFHLPLALAPTGRRVHFGSLEAGWQLTPAVPADSGTVELTQWNLERHTLVWGTGADRLRLDRRTNALGWLHVEDADGAVTLKLRRPWQSYPKSWTYDGDRLGLELFPDLSGFRSPDVEPGRRWTENACRCRPVRRRAGCGRNA